MGRVGARGAVLAAARGRYPDLVYRKNFGGWSAVLSIAYARSRPSPTFDVQIFGEPARANAP